jgi:hypothetical protein
MILRARRNETSTLRIGFRFRFPDDQPPPHEKIGLKKQQFGRG